MSVILVFTDLLRSLTLKKGDTQSGGVQDVKNIRPPLSSLWKHLLLHSQMIIKRFFLLCFNAMTYKLGLGC
jgi:hypothetical protein